MSDTTQPEIEQKPGGHTPGPWATAEAKRPPVYMGETLVVDGGGFIVAYTHTYGGAAHAEANARLIAAAPELLAACEASRQCIADFLEIYKRGGQMTALDEAVRSLRDDALRLTNKALAKAEGKTA